MAKNYQIGDLISDNGGKDHYQVTKVHENDRYDFKRVFSTDGNSLDSTWTSYDCSSSGWILIKSKSMNIKEIFAIGLLPEPLKSYRKAGITNGDNILTDEGAKIFLSYLLEKTPAFKTDVVDNLLKEMEKEAK